MQATLKDIFTALELREEHAKLYLALLEHPNQPAGRIAEYSKLKRTHAYALMADLIAKGLAREIQTEGIRRFCAESAQVMLSQLRTHLQKLKSYESTLVTLTPFLENLIPKSTTQPRVRFFQGVEGLKDLYNLMLECESKIIHACADFATLFPAERSPALNRWLWRYGERRAKRNIWYHGIVNKSSASDKGYRGRKSEKRKVKMMLNSPIQCEICIFDDSVAICSTAKEMMGVLIDSPAIAQSARMLHQCMWNLLSDYK